MSEDSLVNSSRSRFFCPGAPLIIWDLERKVFLRLGIALSAVIFPLYHRYFIAIETTLYLHICSNIQLFSLQCWYKIQQSDDENSSINQHKRLILISHSILSNTLQHVIFLTEIRLLRGKCSFSNKNKTKQKNSCWKPKKMISRRCLNTKTRLRRFLRSTSLIFF